MGDITLTSSMCAMGVDHLALGVVAVNAALDECVVYNNFYLMPMDCRTTGKYI